MQPKLSEANQGRMFFSKWQILYEFYSNPHHPDAHALRAGKQLELVHLFLCLTVHSGLVICFTSVLQKGEESNHRAEILFRGLSSQLEIHMSLSAVVSNLAI